MTDKELMRHADDGGRVPETQWEPSPLAVMLCDINGHQFGDVVSFGNNDVCSRCGHEEESPRLGDEWSDGNYEE